MMAPSSSEGLHFRLDFLLTSNLAAHLPPTPQKRQLRPTRNVKPRPQHRPTLRLTNSPGSTRHHTPSPRHHKTPRPAPPRDDDDFQTAASTDSSLETLSPEIKEMQARARAVAHEQCRQRSDRESLRHLAAVTRANHAYAVRLDRLSLAVLEYATTPKPEVDVGEEYQPQTIGSSEMEAFAASETENNSSPTTASGYGSGSYILVDSQPTLGSDDIFRSAPRYTPSAKSQFVMPTLSYGDDDNSNSVVSSGRPLGGIEEESTGSFSSPSPQLSRSTKPSPSKVEEVSLQPHLQDLEVKDSKGGITQSWLEDQIAEAMGYEADARSSRIEELMTSARSKFEVLKKAIERGEMQEDGTGPATQYDGKEADDSDKGSFVLVGGDEANEDWYDVVTESMVKSKAELVSQEEDQ
ncbi:hypothetical protein PRZ48_002387 [Zasmidium cellare]|uniref:Uncharacterized protein n=1 Tax=Zasmidium cellare TaxID=395010 RepID=A0ABR0F654_ZASCE|nr:hypothetical protein PRZ48_002387 [Zasmidium cellare]